MGSIDITVSVPAGTIQYTTEYYQSPYIIPTVGEEVTMEVVAGDATTRTGLIELIEASGSAAYGTDINGTAWYVDRVRPGADVDSMLVQVQTNNLPEMDEIWGLCVGGEDATTIPGSNRELAIEIAVLARLGEYGTRSDVESALEVTLP